MVKMNFIVSASIFFVAVCLDLSLARRPYYSAEDDSLENVEEEQEESSVPRYHRPVRRLQAGHVIRESDVNDRAEESNVAGEPESEPESSPPEEEEEEESEANVARRLEEERIVERVQAVPELPVKSVEPVSCTCGIFMTGQFQKASKAPPKGNPVVMTEMDETFQCNPAGRKQCVNKCLEMLIKYLPNSPALICAAADRDIHKERAYLFVKNCEDEWHNSNLSAGREYCCKNNDISKCPSS